MAVADADRQQDVVLFSSKKRRQLAASGVGWPRYLPNGTMLSAATVNGL
jgi:hypothetical protein